jgi:hypothetical protein
MKAAGMADGDLHDQIARLEADIEHFAEGLDRCRKAVLLSKVAIAAGRGLFWLSKDFFDPELKASAEPDAQELYDIRNRLEHSYLKIIEMTPREPRKDDPFHDRLAFSVQRDDFIRKTLRLMKLARAALIYLVLGMHGEEERRKAEKGNPRMVAPMWLNKLDDNWKI